MAFAESRDAAHHQSHALGTGLSIGVHGLIAALILFSAFGPPRPADTPNVSIALLAPNLTRPGASGRIGGSGTPAAAERTRPQDSLATREITRVDTPQEIKPAVVIPAMMVDAPPQLPGSAVSIDTSGRGFGPGAGNDAGSGTGGPGSGAGPGRGTGTGDDGFGPGDGGTGPQLIHEVRPAYTVEAMRAKVQGQVELDVVVLADGSVDPKQIRIARSLDRVFGLDAQAIDAVRQWRFRPARNRHQQPVPARVRVELTFTLR